jgi:hypothetical protein
MTVPVRVETLLRPGTRAECTLVSVATFLDQHILFVYSSLQCLFEIAVQLRWFSPTRD